MVCPCLLTPLPSARASRSLTMAAVMAMTRSKHAPSPQNRVSITSTTTPWPAASTPRSLPPLKPPRQPGPPPLPDHMARVLPKLEFASRGHVPHPPPPPLSPTRVCQLPHHRHGPGRARARRQSTSPSRRRVPTLVCVLLPVQRSCRLQSQSSPWSRQRYPGSPKSLPSHLPSRPRTISRFPTSPQQPAEARAPPPPFPPPAFHTVLHRQPTAAPSRPCLA